MKQNRRKKQVANKGWDGAEQDSTDGHGLDQDGADQDGAWKELLDAYLPAFLQFFFPLIYPEIDWARGYEPRDKELAQLRSTDAAGKLLADKLFKVWLLGGQAVWLLIHIEIQVRGSRKFNRRIFVYNYRLMNAHGVEVVSLVVLTGEQPGQSGRYQIERWGCSHDFRFPAVRIVDYRSRWEELETSNNPFAIAVKAQLKVLETKHSAKRRYEWKRRLVFELHQRGYQRQEIINLFRFMDLAVKIPKDLEEKLIQEIYEYEGLRKSPVISTMERLAITRGMQEGIEQGIEKGIEKGLQQGLQQGLLKNVSLIWETKLGPLSRPVKAQLTKLSEEQFALLTALLLADKPKREVLAWLRAQVSGKPMARKTTTRKQR